MPEYCESIYIVAKGVKGAAAAAAAATRYSIQLKGKVSRFRHRYMYITFYLIGMNG